MHLRTTVLSCLLLGAGLLQGCSDRQAPATASTAPAASAPGAPMAATPPAPTASTAATAADAWLGQWNGPEGTFLRIARQGEAYVLTIANLDGPRDFQASASAEGLRFERDGVRESVRAGNGADTGMKWLADKQDCLVVKSGEGYCRG